MLWLAIVARPAHAQPKKFSLNWVRDVGAETCITSHALATVIERMVGPVFVSPVDAELAIEGRVRRNSDESEFSVRIVVSERSGKVLGVRELASSPSNCHVLDAQIALVIVLAIDPEAAVDQLPSELLEVLDASADPGASEVPDADPSLALANAGASNPALPEPAPNAAAGNPAAVLHERLRTPKINPRPRFMDSVRLAAGLIISDAGLLPRPDAGPMLALVMPISPVWSVMLTTALWLPTAAETAMNARKVFFQMLLANPALCMSLWRSTLLEWSGCAGVAVTVRWSDASALAEPSDAQRADVGATASTQLFLEVFGPSFASVNVSVHGIFQRNRFTYRDRDGVDHALFTDTTLAAWAWLALGVHL